MEIKSNRVMQFSEPISFRDVTLYCVACGEAFTFSPSQQIAYADKGWPEPRRCPIHRGHKHRQKQPYRPQNLDDVLDKARREIERYRDSNNGEN